MFKLYGLAITTRVSFSLSITADYPNLKSKMKLLHCKCIKKAAFILNSLYHVPVQGFWSLNTDPGFAWTLLMIGACLQHWLQYPPSGINEPVVDLKYWQVCLISDQSLFLFSGIRVLKTKLTTHLIIIFFPIFNRKGLLNARQFYCLITS